MRNRLPPRSHAARTFAGARLPTARAARGYTLSLAPAAWTL